MSGHGVEFGGFQVFREEWVRKPEGWPSDWIFNQFGKVNIRMEEYFLRNILLALKISVRVIKASNKNNGF